MKYGKSCQVLVIGIADVSNDRVVIVGMNGSENSWSALGWACTEAIRIAGRVVAVVVTPACELITGLEQLVPGANNDASIQDPVDWIETLRNQALQLARDMGVTLKFTHVHGDPVNELLRIADSHRANLIVVGKPTSSTHGIAISLGRRLVVNRDVPIIIEGS